MLGDIDTRLREIKNCQLPFGGLIVVMSGDYQQLPPAVGCPTYTGLLKSLNLASESVSLHETLSMKLFALYKIKYLTVLP